MRKLLPIAPVVVFIAALVLWAYPQWIVGRNADITITKVTTKPNGQVWLDISTKSTSDTTVVEALYEDSKYVGGGSESAGLIPFSIRGKSGTAFGLNPENKPSSGKFEDSPQFARLLAHEGEQRHLREGERWYLYDFKAENGVRHFGYVEIQPHSP